MRWAALAALSLFLLGCTASTTPVGAVNSQTATGARTGPVISPPPVTPPTPPGDVATAFGCKDAIGGKAETGISNVVAVRLGEQAGFDRFVLQFDSRVPSFTIKRLAKPTFVEGASGQSVTLSGSVGALVTLRSTSQAGTYSGSTDITHPEFAVLKEARVVEDFEGQVQWGIGLAPPACMRAFILSDPARLVIDFSTSQ